MSGARHANLFLDMLAAERGASKNTLDAYRRDLDDYLAYLTEAGTAPDKAASATVRGFMASLEERGLGMLDALIGDLQQAVDLGDGENFWERPAPLRSRHGRRRVGGGVALHVEELVELAYGREPAGGR